MSAMFRSLQGRNYRIWFAGAFLSNIGAWMQTTAQNWVVLTELSDNSAGAVGVTMALQFAPQLLLVPFSGAVADKFDRRKVLMITQTLLMLCAAGLGILLVTGVAELWHVYCFALALGVINSFDSTSRQAFVSDLVEPEQLTNAIGLNSASFNSARLVGPAIGGLLIAAVGSGWVFMINAVSFLAVLIALVCIASAPRDRDLGGAQPRESQLRQLGAGFRYVGKRQELLIIFVMVFVLGAFSMNFPIVSSTMAVEFGREAGDYGLLYTMLAIGSLAGALLVARRPAARMRAVIAAAGGVAVASLAAALMPTFWTFAGTLVLLGFSTATLFTTANGFVQSTAAPAVRGRVIALYVAVLVGGTPLGAPLVGAAADQLGARSTLFISAAAALLAFAVGFAWLFIARKLRLRRDQNGRLVVTHIGRPGANDDHRNQVETLTARIDVLRRESVGLAVESSVPEETAAVPLPTSSIGLPGLGAKGEAG